MANGFPRVVLAVLGELHRESVHGAPVQPGDEAFHHLLGNKFNVVVLSDFRQIYRISHVLFILAAKVHIFLLALIILVILGETHPLLFEVCPETETVRIVFKNVVEVVENGSLTLLV